jgi:hypothetical protein
MEREERRGEREKAGRREGKRRVSIGTRKTEREDEGGQGREGESRKESEKERRESEGGGRDKKNHTLMLHQPRLRTSILSSSKALKAKKLPCK